MGRKKKRVKGSAGTQHSRRHDYWGLRLHCFWERARFKVPAERLGQRVKEEGGSDQGVKKRAGTACPNSLNVG